MEKKNAGPFGTFFAMIISLWFFETQMKNWYHWRDEILNFVMMYLICCYSHPFKRYGSVSRYGILCSQSRLIHFLISHFKNFLFVQSFNDGDCFAKFFFKKISVVIVPLWWSQCCLTFYDFNTYVILLTDCLEKVYISDLKNICLLRAQKCN